METAKSILKNLATVQGKIIAIIISCIIASMTLIITQILMSYYDIIDKTAHQTLQYSKARFAQLEGDEILMMSSTLEALLVNRDLKNLYLKRDRPGLLRAALGLHTTLKKNYGITHLYFHNPEPDSTNFLRVHHPDENGDRITRITYVQAMKNKKISAGKELGSTDFALRVVSPYYDEAGRLIGYMELGKEINHYLSTLSKETGSQYRTIINKKYLKQAGWEKIKKEKNQRNNWNDMKDQVVVQSTSLELETMLAGAPVKEIPDEGIITGRMQYGDKHFMGSAFPIWDAARNKVGYVNVFKDISDLVADINARTVRLLLLGGLIMAGLCAATILISRKITKSMGALINRVRNLNSAEGDLTIELNLDSNDEMGELAEGFNKFVKKIHGAVTGVKNIANQVTAAVTEMSDVTLSFSQSTQDQAAASETIMSVFEELSSGMDMISQNADEQSRSLDTLVDEFRELTSTITAMGQQVGDALKAAAEVSDRARAGENFLQSMNAIMTKVGASSKEMDAAIGIINEISDKINLLSLNASIESARAGEAGRGFAVVANEISKLADQTAVSIKEIDDQIKSNLSDIAHGVSAVHEVTNALTAIIDGVNVIDGMITSMSLFMTKQLETNNAVNDKLSDVKSKSEEIKLATSEQKNAVGETVRSIENVNALSQEIAAGSEQLSVTGKYISDMSDNLKAMVNFFKI